MYNTFYGINILYDSGKSVSVEEVVDNNFLLASVTATVLSQVFKVFKPLNTFFCGLLTLFFASFTTSSNSMRCVIMSLNIIK